MKPKDVDEYISNFPEKQKVKLAELRDIVRTVLPDTQEDLKWGAPAMIENDGMILMIYSGHKQHLNFVVTPSTKGAFKDELSEYDTGKGSIKLSYEKPLPAHLLKKMALYRANEYRTNGINWK